MKRQDTDHLQSGLLRLLDDFARERKLSIADEATQARLLDELSTVIQESRTNPIRLHGFRVQAMFAYLAAALGNSKIISEEDSGIFFDGLGSLRQPDFRIVTLDGSQFLVEVKNFHESGATKPYKFRKSYLDEICAYAEQMDLPLKFAIYWSQWHIWTLVDSSWLDRSSAKALLPLTTAMERNEMNILGDSMIGTKPPLALRVHADPTKPRSIDQSGKAQLTIKEVTLHSAGAEITDEIEKKIAWFLMSNGKWADVQHTVEANGSEIQFTELSVAPMEPTENQAFDIVGMMSEMISHQYLQATSKDGVIRSLAPEINVNQLGVIIPRNYKGEALLLWILNLQPKSKGAAKMESS